MADDQPDRDRDRITELIARLVEEPETFHPALSLAFRYQLSISKGTLDLGELITSQAEIEQAIESGERSLKACEATVSELLKCTPRPRRDRPPVGF